MTERPDTSTGAQGWKSVTGSAIVTGPAAEVDVTIISFNLPNSSFDYWHTNDVGVPTNASFLAIFKLPERYDEQVEATEIDMPVAAAAKKRARKKQTKEHH